MRRIQVPLPTSFGFSHLALAKRLIGLKPRGALHSTALALGQIPKKSNSFHLSNLNIARDTTFRPDVWPRELLTVRRGDLPGDAPGGRAGWSRALSSRQRGRLQELASD